MALWQADATTEIKCVRRIDATTDVQISTSGLTIGNTYYISVDNYVGAGYRGTFTLCIDDAVNYDEPAGAITITHSANNCSANAAYSTLHATADGNAGSCWENGPNYTRWFKFVATTSNVTLDLKVGGAQGSMQHPNLALWQSDATTEIKCVRRVDATTDVQISTSGLTIGNTYYVSVDNYVGLGNRGTFTLCIDNAVTYDDIAGAIEIIHTTNNCSPNAAYSTVHATADGNAGSCWENGPNYTRWFKFVATTTNVTLDLKVGGAEGTLQHPNMALWESDATTEVKCVRRINATTDVQISTSGLTIGNTYYVSVDNYVGLGNRGTFTLCIDNAVTYDDIAGAIEIIHTTNNCSPNAAYSTVHATPDGLKGSCWENGPNYTRWFKFVATTNEVILDLKVGGVEGTLQHPNMALWESDGITEINCVRRINATEDVQIVYSSLSIGNTYYVSVDNFVGMSYRGTFTLCISDQSNYDNISGALTIIHTANNCSSNAAYTTVNATADGLKGSCWENGPNYTRWFKFVATTNYLTLDLKVGGAEGTMQHPNMALWESDATTEIACVRRINATTDVQIAYPNLVIGNTYYVSVDNFVGLSYRGSFTLCIDNQLTYDYVEGAIELTNLNNWCSQDAEYTTIHATPDGLKGSCWENGPNYTRWFKFVAVSPNVTLQMKVGGAEGTLQHPNIALWQSDAVTQVGCTKRINASTDISLSSAALVVGNTYYISCDNYVGSGYRGTFTLCIDNVDTEYYSIVDGAWNDGNNWSIVYHNGPAAASYPNAGDIAYIKGNTITVTGNEVAAEINLSDTSLAATNLTINGGTLTISGQASMRNDGTNLDQLINITGGGSLVINDKFTATRAGGNNPFYINIDNNSSLTINKDFSFISSGGGTINNQLTLNGNGILTINRDLFLTETGGIKTLVQLNNNAALNVNRNLSIQATNNNKVEIELNNNSNLRIKRNFLRGTPAYGILTSNNNSTVTYNGTGNSQIVAGGGSGTGDLITYRNLVFNNTHISIPQFTLNGNISIPNGSSVTLIDGIIATSTTNLLTIEAGGTISGGSSNSYIDGPISKIGNTSFTFPTGNNGYYCPIGISPPSTITDEFRAEYKRTQPNNRNNLAPTLSHVSSLDLWDLNRISGSSSLYITLYWNSSDHGITSLPDLAVSHYDSGTNQWENMGGLAAGSSSAGTILSSVLFTSFSPITLGSLLGTNPLPIKLISFKANLVKKDVWLEWKTETEINNDYFTIERSANLENWEFVKKLKGAGNSNTVINYSAIDEKPLTGVSYYRLKQTDFNGDFSYSDVVAINNKSLGDIVVYPNPVKDLLTIKTNCENCIIKVYSAIGQLVYNGTEKEINTSNWAKGAYEVVIINNDGSLFNTKVIK
ncbi:MAG: T9SS type A sorting domain-containing protein [Flavobacteriales bacterium]|nr:T9SS type A sorting domain-containing protein [Flavobacteriales bacterium]